MTPLGQIEKRLEIIRIAISMTDEETISLQRLKLRRHRDNKTLDSILSVLDDGNYAQATSLIERFINVPKEEVKKRVVTPSPRDLKDIEEEKLIKKFGLFTEKGRRDSINELYDGEELTSILDLPSIERVQNSPLKKSSVVTKDRDSRSMVTQESIESQGAVDTKEEVKEVFSPKPSTEVETNEAVDIFASVPKEPIQNPTTEDILAQYDSLVTDHIPNKVTIPTSIESQTDKYEIEEFEIKEYKIKTLDDGESFSSRSQDDDGDEEEPYVDDTPEHLVPPQEPTVSEDVIEPTTSQSKELQELQAEVEAEVVAQEPKTEVSVEYDDSVVVVIDEPEPSIDIEYESISYIDQKVKNMFGRYPQIESSDEKFDSEESLLYKISLDGYTESDIVKCIDEVFALIANEKLAEASHLLIIAASTESIYAQFILARELFRGRVLQQNIPEAFTQINQLAQEDYPEAVCDLAQFYEHGIGTAKNKKKAFRLYEDALDLGIERADTHLTKMEEESKGIFGKLFRKK